MALGINHGGARPNSGPKKGSKAAISPNLPAEFDPFSMEPLAPPESSQPKTDYNSARARVEQFKAKNYELEYLKNLGALVSRAAVQSASATAMASFAQSMRSMQDDMERKLNLAPEVVEAIGNYVDDALAQLAQGFELFRGGTDEMAD